MANTGPFRDSEHSRVVGTPMSRRPAGRGQSYKMFINCRHDGGLDLAEVVRKRLVPCGYGVFPGVYDMPVGPFKEMLTRTDA